MSEESVEQFEQKLASDGLVPCLAPLLSFYISTLRVNFCPHPLHFLESNQCDLHDLNVKDAYIDLFRDDTTAINVEKMILGFPRLSQPVLSRSEYEFATSLFEPSEGLPSTQHMAPRRLGDFLWQSYQSSASTLRHTVQGWPSDT